jgi:hypothetical protein
MAAESLLEETGAWGHPILAIFDSWGNVNVPLSLIQRLARNPSSEVIVTFGPNWFNRQEKLQPEKLNMVFGGHQYWESADQEGRTEERWRAWLTTYRQALQRAGFQFQLQFRIVPKTGQPLYLVYGTSHPRGVQVMKNAMWEVDGNDGMGFQDPRTRGAPVVGQLAFFAGTNDPELLELVQQRLETGPVSLEQLGHWLDVETARWRARDASKAVAALQKDGVILVTPQGKLTKTSMIKLR